MTDCNSNDNDVVQQNNLQFLTARAETVQEITARSVFRNTESTLPKCLDSTDQEQVAYRDFLQTDRPTVSNGLYTINAVDSLANDFSNSFVLGAGESNIINRNVNRYGEVFYSSLNNLNGFLNGRDLSEYPTLSNRVGDVPITPIEYAEFLEEFIYTPAIINTNIIFSANLLLSQMDDFYTRNFTQSTIGGFCALMPKVFEAIDFFFDAVGFLSKGINGVIAALTERALQELMRKIAEEVSKIIDKTVLKVLNIIRNFDINDFFGEIETFVNERIVERVSQLKEDILTFFTRENLNKIKKKVEDLITYAVSVFENPSIEEIQFLVYRFCSFAAQVEALINGLKDPLANFAGGYQGVIRGLRAVSDFNTARAVAAGALRYAFDTRRDLINTGETEFIDRGNPPESRIDDVSDIPTWEEISSGSSSSFGVVLGNQSFASNPPGQRQEEGWTQLNRSLLAKLVRIQRRFGRKIIVISGFRNPALNDQVGGEENSQHLAKTAVDMTWSGFNTSSMEDLIAIAIDERIGGIGRYPGQSFVHLDIGPRRSWRG